MLSLKPSTPAQLALFTLSVFEALLRAAASNGDRSYVFVKCFESCYYDKLCWNVSEFELAQPAHLRLLLWSCQDECNYQCMWNTVEAFQKDGSRIPQFFGKWPFIRFAGIQEPASMVFSLLNAAAHLAIFYYRSKVPTSSNMYRVWHGMAFVATVAWLCATVFHTRDTPITEMMDYFSAFALVLYNLFTLLCRVVGTNRRPVIAAIAFFLIGLYCYHIHYLAFVNFDYGYNMTVNVTVGILNGLGWILFCAYYWKRKPCVKKCFCVIIGLNVLLLLELGDFPPLLWTFDAHAIWHGGTVPLTLLWYSFIVEDALDEISEEAIADVKKIA